MTPAGPLPASHVHPVPKGGSIDIVGNEIHLLDAAKNVVHVAQVNNTELPGWKNGWIAYAAWYNTGSSPISYLNTTWKVPPAPATYNGQLVYLFNSIEPGTGAAILQPVLQYGISPAGGGAYWSVANWYVTSTDAYHTSLADVAVGQALYGIIELLSTSASGYTYASQFDGIGDALYLNNSAELVWATETLEAYGVTAATDYPSGSTLFYNINLYATSVVPSVSWYVVNDVADGLYASVVTDGATNAEIEITYPTN